MFDTAVRLAVFKIQRVALAVDDAEHRDQSESLIEGGGMAVAHFAGAEPIVSTSVAPSCIWA